MCTAEHDDTEEEIIGLVAEDTLETNLKSKWIVDSGATCHICKDEGIFTELS